MYKTNKNISYNIRDIRDIKMNNDQYDNTMNRLTRNQREFFDKLSFYIDKPINFYGSIQRVDYIPGKSDVDVDIFTDNESSTIQMVCSFLHIPRKQFRKTVLKINSHMVYGYKGKYEDEKNGINVEISTYVLALHMMARMLISKTCHSWYSFP